MTLPLALAELGLIDEYEFVVHPRLAGHGPTVFAAIGQIWGAHACSVPAKAFCDDELLHRVK